MRYLAGLACALALGALPLVGCSDPQPGDGTGGTGGDPYPGNCGDQGQGGGANWIYPGLYLAEWDDDSANYQACVYVNDDCTALEASSECNLGEDDSQAHLLEIEWTAGREENGEECAAGVGVTADLVTTIPIDARIDPPMASFSFYVEFSDTDGAAWEVSGEWSYDNLFVSARRITGDVVCRPHIDYPTSICPLAPPANMCLVPEGY